MLNMIARMLCVLLIASMCSTKVVIASEMRWSGDCLVMKTSESLFSKNESSCVRYKNCKGRCGYFERGESCSCDNRCWFHGNCCPDYLIVCLNLHPGAKAEEILDPILSTYNSLYHVQRFRDQVNWISALECHDTMYGAKLLVSKCSRTPEITSRYYDMLQRISSLKTKSLFLKYLSDKSIVDITKSCEETSSKTESEKFLLDKLHYFDQATAAAFYNVFCALCNGVLPKLDTLYVQCQIENYETFMSMSSLNKLIYNYQCSISPNRYMGNITSCNKTNRETMRSLEHKPQLSEQQCFKTWYIFDNMDRIISFKNPDCFHCFLDKIPEGYEYIGHLEECKSLKCNCSVINMSIYKVNKFIFHFNVINVHKSLSISVEPCEVHQIYQPWSTQCQELLCDRNHKPFYGNCIQFYGCCGSNRTKEDSLGLRPINKVSLVLISQLFKSVKMPKLHLQMTYHAMGEMSQNVLNFTEKNDNRERKGDLDFGFTLQKLLSLSKTNVTLMENEQYFEHLMNIFFKDFSHRLSEDMGGPAVKGKVVESLFCYHTCLQDQTSAISKQPFFTDKYNQRNLSESTQCYSEFPKQGKQSGNTFESSDASFYFFIRAEYSVSVDPIIRMILTTYKATNTKSWDYISTMFKSNIIITNMNSLRSDGQTPRQDYETYEELSTNETNDKTCPKGRQLIFSQVDVNKNIFEQKNDIKMYLDTDELPLDNPWFEMSFSYDINEIVIDKVIVSLCVSSLNDTFRFCYHGSVLLFPYSSVYFYKQLLIISADINKVTSFFQNVEYKYYPQVELIDHLERYTGQWGLKVYHKTSYILTNKGAMVCTNSSNIYQDDREKIAHLFKRQSNTGVIFISLTMNSCLTRFLLYLACLYIM